MDEDPPLQRRRLTTEELARVIVAVTRKKQDPLHDLPTGGLNWYTMLRHESRDDFFKDQIGMTKESFDRLLDILITHGGLTDGYKVCSGQKLMMFLDILKGQGYKRIELMWMCTRDTVRRVCHEVASAVIACRGFFLREKHADDPVADRIAGDPRLAPYFQDCIGALDGTYVKVTVPEAAKRRYRSRKNVISQNVLVVCDFDGVLIYILAGWEGTQHDSGLLYDAMQKALPLFPGKYYLGDGGFPLLDCCLVPYRGVLYHERDYRGRREPLNYKEIFNMRHCSARNIIERTFGIAKQRFKMLDSGVHGNFSTAFQTILIMCAFMLHSFLMMQRDMPPPRDQPVPPAAEAEEEDCPADGAPNPTAFRDRTAHLMWQHYQE
jgi:hypothetical protein